MVYFYSREEMPRESLNSSSSSFAAADVALFTVAVLAVGLLEPTSLVLSALRRFLLASLLLAIPGMEEASTTVTVGFVFDTSFTAFPFPLTSSTASLLLAFVAIVDVLLLVAARLAGSSFSTSVNFRFFFFLLDELEGVALDKEASSRGLILEVAFFPAKISSISLAIAVVFAFPALFATLLVLTVAAAEGVEEDVDATGCPFVAVLLPVLLALFFLPMVYS